MLGEAARTEADAQALPRAPMPTPSPSLGERAAAATMRDNPGISVKLSALHPRYERGAARRAMLPVMAERAAGAGAGGARRADMGFNIDAEEADRLDLSLDVIEARAGRSARLPAGTGSAWWCRPMGRAPAYVIDWLYALAPQLDRTHHGAAGQGRLLGHRDQARAGAGARRLSRCSPARPRPTSPTSPAREAARR